MTQGEEKGSEIPAFLIVPSNDFLCPSYRDRMKIVSQIVKDRPMTPQQLVVYWTEYIIRHNGTRHLRVVGKDMPLYKYLMLDIVAVGVIGVSVIVFLTVALTRRICVAQQRVDLVKKVE